MPITTGGAGDAVTGLLGNLPLGSITAGSLLGLWFLLLMLGKMPTPAQMRDLREDRDYWRGSADTWQKVATQNGMTLERHTETLEKLLANDDAILHVVREIQQAARGGAS